MSNYFWRDVKVSAGNNYEARAAADLVECVNSSLPVNSEELTQGVNLAADFSTISDLRDE